MSNYSYNEHAKIEEELGKMIESGEDKTNPKHYNYLLDKWEELQSAYEYECWCNSQPI